MNTELSENNETSEPAPNTGARKGKIARLPAWLRDQVNERLNDGEPAGSLLEWLNGHRETQEVLKDHFNGAPINPQNLSEWRQGGFREWQPRLKDADHARALKEHAELIEDQADGRDLSDCLAPLVSLELAKSVKSLVSEESDRETKWQRLRQLLSALTELRRADHQALRIRREQEQWERDDDAADEEDWKAEKEKMKKEVLAPFNALLHRMSLHGLFGDGVHGKWAAEFIAAVEHDQPVPHFPKLDADQTKSGKIKPNQSKSNKKRSKNRRREQPLQPEQVVQPEQAGQAEQPEPLDQPATQPEQTPVSTDPPAPASSRAGGVECAAPRGEQEPVSVQWPVQRKVDAAQPGN